MVDIHDFLSSFPFYVRHGWQIVTVTATLRETDLDTVWLACHLCLGGQFYFGKKIYNISIHTLIFSIFNEKYNDVMLKG